MQRPWDVKENCNNYLDLLVLTFYCLNCIRGVGGAVVRAASAFTSEIVGLILAKD